MRRPYIRCMRNLPLYRYPSAAELYALEQEARRLRAAEIARLFHVAVSGWKALWAPRTAKGLRHA
jgi:hypothetical protein